MTTATTTATATKGPDSKGWFWGTGRRKTAIARVRVRAGNGDIKLNEKTLDDYLTEDRDRKHVLSVLEKTGTKGKVDVTAGLVGGGFTGQTGAMVMGLARALLAYDSTLEPMLRENGFLTRDARKVERKKYGQAGARRRYQFSKR
ncbi:MAG: 30S ribosomal protein S9 [Planctomycetes bacterium]|jgi:small subunit ribosomal protein S9|nr:30S ribosomal protein S9 [Planctomycetota bacterium]